MGLNTERHTEEIEGSLCWRVDLTWEELEARLAQFGTRTSQDARKIAAEGWHGPELSKTLADMRHGSPELAQQAEAGFVEALDSCMADTEGEETRESGPVGSYPNVPAFVQGRPDSMWGRGEDEGLGPVRMFVGIGCQADITHEQMLARGVAIAALAYAMQSVRPVELWICYATKGTHGSRPSHHLVFQTQLAIAPLDLSLVSVGVCATGIGRRVLRFGKTMSEYGEFASISATAAFNLGPDDLFFPNVVPGDAPKIDKSPLGFILEQVRTQDQCQVSTLARHQALGGY